MMAKLRHKVILCSQHDVVVTGAELRLQREGVWEAWASIEPKKASTFSPYGAAMRESRDQRTHVVMTRYRSDLNISVMAWLYEKRLQSSPRWFKILAVNQTEVSGSTYFKFDCRLVERGDDLASPTEAVEPSGPAVGLPHGVRL